MALTVETGEGLADAESYVSVAEFKAYAGKVGYNYTTPAYSDTQIEQALRRATVWIDARYRDQFQGSWTTSTQALEWPRSGVLYRRTAIDAYSIPDQLKNALCEAAWRELTSPGSMSPDQFGDQIKRDKVGDVETEFRAGAVGARPWVPIIDDLLSGLLKGRASAYVGKAVRA
jgi:hypothetical protein